MVSMNGSEEDERGKELEESSFGFDETRVDLFRSVPKVWEIGLESNTVEGY